MIELNCQDCRHEDTKNLPRNFCLKCKHMDRFEPKENLIHKPDCDGNCNGNCNCGDFNEQH